MIIYIKKYDKNDKLGNIDKLPKFMKNIIIYIYKIFNKFLSFKIDNNNKKYMVFNVENEKVYKKIINNIKKEQKINKKNIKIAFSNDLIQYKRLFDKFKLISYKELIYNNIETVLANIVGNNPLEEQVIYVLSNNYSKVNVNFIKKLLHNVKSLNIITKHIEKYKILEDLMIEEGYLVTCLNNKKKSLQKAKIIINLDFKLDEIGKYNIFRNACIINLTNENIINVLKGFDGMIVQNIEPYIENQDLDFLYKNNLLNDFDKNILFQCINKENKNIRVNYLYGNNGKISEKELLNMQKILTNLKK